MKCTICKEDVAESFFIEEKEGIHDTVELRMWKAEEETEDSICSKCIRQKLKQIMTQIIAGEDTVRRKQIRRTLV